MGFDYQAALKDGASKQEILQFVEEKGLEKFDFEGARKAGADDDAIFEFLTKPPQTSKELMSQVTTVQQAEAELETSKPVVDTEQPTFQVSKYEAPRADIVQPEDGTATAPVTMGLGLDGASVETPQYAPEKEFARVEGERQEAAQKQATKSSFPTPYVDPKSGAEIEVQPGGLETDIPILTGKLAAVRMLSHPVIKNAVEKYAATTGVTLGKEAMIILGRNPELEPQVVDALLKDVPKEDQAYILSRALGPEGAGYIKQAVNASGDTERIALRNELRKPREKLLDSIGDIDIDKAKAKYADMVETVAKDYKNVHDGRGMLEDLNFLERFYGVTPSKGNAVVNQMKAVLGDNNKISLSDALEFRGDINYLLSKAKRGSEKVKLNRIKENIDGFINRTASPEQKVLIDDAVSTYARTMQNRDLADIIAKHSRSGETIVEDGVAVVSNPNAIATDWVKVKRELADANLNTPEVKMAVNAVEQFAKRFAGDPMLANVAAVRGSSPDAGGVLGAWGYAVNQIKDIFALYGNRAENLKIQKAILKSIRNSNTNKEFIDALLKNKTIPDEAKGAVVKAFSPEPVPQLPYNPGARQTGDVNLTPIVPPRGGRLMDEVQAGQAPRVTRAAEEVPAPAQAADETLPAPRIDASMYDDSTREMLESSREALTSLESRLMEQYDGSIANMPTGIRQRLSNFRARQAEVNERLAAKDSQKLASKSKEDLVTTHLDNESDIEMMRMQFNSVAEMPPEVREQYDQLVARGEEIRANITDRIFEAAANVTKPSQVASVVNDTANIATTRAEVQVASDEVIRQIRRIERTRAADRTESQLEQLAELRQRRSELRNKLRDLPEVPVASTNIGSPEDFIASSNFTASSRPIRDSDGDSRFLDFENSVVRVNEIEDGKIHIYTTGFSQGSGVGGRFYAQFYDDLDRLGLKHAVTGLTDVNVFRLPVNIYKHYIKTGNAPVTYDGKEGRDALEELFRDAIYSLEDKVRAVRGRGNMQVTNRERALTRRIKNMASYTDEQLAELAPKLGAMDDVHVGENSLKLYRQAAKLMRDGSPLALIALAPFIEDVIKEMEGENVQDTRSKL